jgi:hypothetical protein
MLLKLLVTPSNEKYLKDLTNMLVRSEEDWMIHPKNGRTLTLLAIL